MKNVFFSFILCSTFSSLSLAECNDFNPKSELTSRFKTEKSLVLDMKTNLIWQRCSIGTTWSSDNSCKGDIEYMGLSRAKEVALKLAGGWRVPNIDELYSIVELNCYRPSINQEIFPSVTEMSEGAPYWSSSQIEDFPILYYFVDFSDASVDGHTLGFSLAVRLVKNNGEL